MDKTTIIDMKTGKAKVTPEKKNKQQQDTS